MKNREQNKKPIGKTLLHIILGMIIAITIAMTFAPEMAKPLLVKYYRSLYSAESLHS